MKNGNLIHKLCALAFLLPVFTVLSCGKHETPSPAPPVNIDTVLAKYIAVSFTHHTGSNLFYDSVSHTYVPHATNDSTFRPDTLIVTQLGTDSIRLSGSLISDMSGHSVHYDLAISSTANYTYPLNVHSFHEFHFFNGYDSVSTHYWYWTGASSYQFSQWDIYFSGIKQ